MREGQPKMPFLGRKQLSREKPQVFLFFFFPIFILLFIYFFILGPNMPACGGSQVRGRIRAAAAGLHHSHSNTGSEPHL